MATIFLGVSGEGRGHAARAQVLIDLLKAQHRVVVYAYGAALELLAKDRHQKNVELRPIEGMRFSYDRRGRLDPLGTIARALPFLSQLKQRAATLARVMEREAVDLALVDFEPLLPRAANLAGIPVVSIDHQQFLKYYDLDCLPPSLSRKANILAPLVSAYYTRLDASVISAFFFPELKKDTASHPIVQAGVLLRSEILAASPDVGQHFVAYVRRNAPPQVLEALHDSKLPVRVYGHMTTGTWGNLSFKSIDRKNFVSDLSQSRGLITSAGNQVVGEALFLRKPVLAYPEPGNFEQAINGHFLNDSGQGLSERAERFSAKLVLEFSQRRAELVDRIRPERLSGNRLALSTIHAYLNQSVVHRSQDRARWRKDLQGAIEVSS